MPDPRWSASEITGKFSLLTDSLNSQFRRLTLSEIAVDKLLDVVDMLEARITELEEAMDAMEAHQ